MLRAFKYLILLTILAISCEKRTDMSADQDAADDVRIVWETPQEVVGAGGGYPRSIDSTMDA